MKVISVLKDVLSLTAWEMETPKPYSAFHLALCAAGIPLAVLAARRLAKKRGAAPKAVLFSCGLFLLFLELYKQAFLFFIEFDGHFNWWYFPFQLCSIPMYLCLLYPQSGKYSAVFSTFIQDFGLLGGIMALAVPAGLMHPYWTMTLHGFLWHFLLIFLGLYCGMSGLSSPSLPKRSRSFSSAASPRLPSTRPPAHLPAPICSTYPRFTRLPSRFSTKSPWNWGFFPEFFSTSPPWRPAPFSSTASWVCFLPAFLNRTKNRKTIFLYPRFSSCYT